MPLTRRRFLRAACGTSTLLSLGPLTPAWLLRSVRAATALRHRHDTVLVVLQLTGGNDGLNTVVPYADDAYGRNRFTLRLPPAALHKIDSLVGFHPQMAAFARLYRDGYLSIVQGVGSAHPDQNHDRALRMWHTADPDRPARQTGWLGRVADRAWNPAAPDSTAVFVGPIPRPFALNAENVIVPAVRRAEDLTIHDAWAGVSARGSLPLGPRPESGAPATAEASPDPSAAQAKTDPLLQFVRQSTRDARARSERIEAALKASGGPADYPPFGLARDLGTVAQLIRADLGIRIFFVELGGGGIGGFDNHANQAANHGALLHQLAESVAAFLYDLQRDRQLDRVLLMTFSEFGRSVRENGRRGTDHGVAAPLFLAGGRVKGGLVGDYPSLADLDKGGLKVRIDFRRIYATVLDRWLDLDRGSETSGPASEGWSETVLGGRFEPLNILPS